MSIFFAFVKNFSGLSSNPFTFSCGNDLPNDRQSADQGPISWIAIFMFAMFTFKVQILMILKEIHLHKINPRLDGGMEPAL